MKKIWFKSAFLALCGMSMTSCGDFLDIYPLTMVYEDNYWNEKNDVDQILLGCYTRMQDADFLKRAFIWGESRSDNIIRNSARTNFSATSSEGYIMSENIMSTNAYTSWACYYMVINRCNLVIQKAPEVAQRDPNYLQSDVNATIAEASALRALCYFYLVRAFKDVPYYTHAITNDEEELNLPVTDGDQIIRNLIADLLSVRDNALTVWPTQNGVDVSYARITKDAINALLADMSLWIQDYSNAATYADLVIQSKNAYFETHPEYTQDKMADYPLLVDNGNSFRYTGYAFTQLFGAGGSPESIFELEFSTNTSDGSMDNTMISDFFRRPLAQVKNNLPEQGLFAPSEKLWTAVSSTSDNIFLSTTDSRIQGSIETSGGASASSQDIGYVAKYVYSLYQLVGTTAEYGRRNYEKNDANWIFYRVSDMLLIRAEALICQMSGNMTEEDEALGRQAFALIKAVADRSAAGTNSNLEYSGYSTKEALYNLVYDERRREFLFEGKRWFDLVRRSRVEGNTNYLVDAVSAKFTDGNQTTATGKLGNMMAIYWPYNYDEVTVNPNLTQNPAYPEEGSSFESTN